MTQPRTCLPVALIAANSFILVVNPSLAVRSIDDLVKLARNKPGPPAYGIERPRRNWSSPDGAARQHDRHRVDARSL